MNPKTLRNTTRLPHATPGRSWSPRRPLVATLGGVLLLAAGPLHAQFGRLTETVRQVEETTGVSVTGIAEEAGIPAGLLGFLNADDPEGRVPPELQLEQADGSSFSLQDLLETVVLLELVDMSSPESQAFAGANLLGEVEGLNPNRDVLSVNEYVDAMLGEEVREEGQLIHVAIVVADENGEPPTGESLETWSNLFGLTEDRGKRVVMPTAVVRRLPLQQFAPRFHVLGRDGHVAATASGDDTAGGLHQQIVPTIGRLLGLEEETTDEETIRLTDDDIRGLDPLYEVETPYDLPTPPRPETPYDAPQFPDLEVPGDLPAPPQVETPYNASPAEELRAPDRGDVPQLPRIRR